MANHNYRGFCILNIDATPIKGSASFDYKGFTISMSTVFQPDVAVFNDDQCHSVDTVEDAIAWVDNYQAEQVALDSPY